MLATDEDATDASLNACSAGMWSRPRLSGAVDAVLEAGQLLGSDRTARVKLASGDTDLGAEAELAAVGELGRGVMQNDRRIDLVEEFLRGVRVLRDDCIGMVRAVSVDMRDRLIDAVHDTGRDDGVEIFGVPVLVGRGLYARISSLDGLVATHLAAGLDQHRHQWPQARRRAG